MNTYTLVTDGHEALRSKSSDWDFNDPALSSEVLEREISRLITEHRGLGFAANQMGLTTRVFAMNFGDIKFYYNPRILGASDELVVFEEGCLSFPGLMLKVKRPSDVVVSYQDRGGESHIAELSDLEARCFQHELDHLDGICFDGRVSKLVLGMARKKQSKRTR